MSTYLDNKYLELNMSVCIYDTSNDLMVSVRPIDEFHKIATLEKGSEIWNIIKEKIVNFIYSRLATNGMELKIENYAVRFDFRGSPNIPQYSAGKLADNGIELALGYARMRAYETRVTSNTSELFNMISKFYKSTILEMDIVPQIKIPDDPENYNVTQLALDTWNGIHTSLDSVQFEGEKYIKSIPCQFLKLDHERKEEDWFLLYFGFYALIHRSKDNKLVFERIDANVAEAEIKDYLEYHRIHKDPPRSEKKVRVVPVKPSRKKVRAVPMKSKKKKESE